MSGSLKDIITSASEPRVLYEVPEDSNGPELRDMKQRTEHWLEAREDGSMSSSNLWTALGYGFVRDAHRLQLDLMDKVNF